MILCPATTKQAAWESNATTVSQNKKNRRILLRVNSHSQGFNHQWYVSRWSNKEHTPFCFYATILFSPVTGVGLRNSKTSHRSGSIDCLKMFYILLLKGYSWCISVLVMVTSVIWINSISTVGINEKREKNVMC